MVLLIGFYCGITGISAVVAIVGANVAMILFGWLQEVSNPPGRDTTTMLPFWFGSPRRCRAVGGHRRQPRRRRLLDARLRLRDLRLALRAFMSFALNQWLQYREVGPWRSYAFGEKTYLVLSLVAKSALAWQIFSGSLAS